MYTVRMSTKIYKGTADVRLDYLYFNLREKRRDLTQSYDKGLYTLRKIKNNVTTQNAPETSITQRLWTNIGRSVGVTGRPKSVRNRCVIEVFGGVFVFSRCFLGFSVSVGAFVVGLRQIFYFSSL